MSLRLLPLLVGCLLAGPLYAQAPPLKWGDIPDEHLRMTVFPADTNARAVVLADYGEVRFNPNHSVVFTRHRRIKILSEGGYDWGTFSITYLDEDKMEYVSSVRGQTFTVGPKGKVQRHKMEKSAIFREDVDGRYKRVRFTLPALAPGAVIEYSYQVNAVNPVLVPDWSFQFDEPVLWSEYRMEIPNTLGYVQVSRGVLNFHLREMEDVKRPWGEGRRLRLVMRDVPALRYEPFMTTPFDYRAYVEFQLAQYYVPRQGIRSFMKTWDDLARELMEHKDFGGELTRQRRVVAEQAAAVTAGLTDPEEKMRALYDYVRTAIAWDGRGGIFAYQNLDEVLEKHQGSSAEMALLLTMLLREAGLTANPVLISTRSNGRILDTYPLLSQFNRVLVAVDLMGDRHLLDATDPLRPYDLLPVEALNGRGWLIRPEDNTWIAVASTGRYVRQLFVAATLDAEGTLTARVRASDGGYSALQKRHTLQEEKPDAFVRDVILADLPGVTLDSHAVMHREELTEVLQTTAAFTLPAYAQAAGDYLYLNPTLLDRQEENPLRLPERSFPVDFAHPYDLNYTLQLTVPEGFTIQEHPRDLRVIVPGGGARFQRQVRLHGQTLTVQTRFVLDRTVFEPNQYAGLRNFYGQVVAMHAEQVVLKQERAASAEAGGAR